MAGPTFPDSSEVFTVAAVNRLAKDGLETAFPSIWVSGQISKITRAASGHVYVTLKDESATIETTIFRGALLRVRFELEEGLQVLARGRLTIFERNGKFQLNIAEMLPKGMGALELAFQQLKEKLASKGYFDARRKKKLPRFPRSIALVTSPSGAAVRDMLEILARRWPIANVMVVPVRVQGDGAAAEIAAAIRRLNQLHAAGSLSIDAMIVGRGGGSLEDLWAFNEEVVADAIFSSAIPVISAVGHETDYTISDQVADYRALTPSHAITDLTPDRDELIAGLPGIEARLRERARRRIEIDRQRLLAAADRRVFRSPLDRVRDLERRLDDVDDRLRRAGRVRVDKGSRQIEALAGRLESLSPLGVLARGYSLTLTEDGRVVRSIAATRAGERIITRVADGVISSRVEEQS